MMKNLIIKKWKEEEIHLKTVGAKCYDSGVTKFWKNYTLQCYIIQIIFGKAKSYLFCMIPGENLWGK